MAPVASSLSAKLRLWITMDDAFTTNGKVVLCRVCDKKVGCTMKSQLEQHIRSALHNKNKQLRSVKKQTLLTQMQTDSSRSEFYKDLCEAMIVANIPWNKVQVPKYRAFLEKYYGRQVPDESTLRKGYLDACYEHAVESITMEIGSSHIWFAVDESTDVLGRYIANLVVGRLSSDNASKLYIIASRVLERTDHTTVARFVNDRLKVLWPGCVQEEKVLVMYTDSAAYMLKAAAKALKVFYPHLIHFICLAHAIHRVAEEVRSHFPQVNELVSSTKKVFVKAPLRVQAYREQLPHVKLPPQPILTRWSTWINAVNFYSEHLQAVKNVVDSFPPESAISVRDTQRILQNSEIACEVAYIKSNFGWIAEKIEKLETVVLSLMESMDIICDVKNKLSAVRGSVGEKVMKKFISVLERNPGYDSLYIVSQILSGEMRDTPKDISPNHIHLLKYAPVTSCDVERSFSLYKNILSDRRQNLTAENMEKYLVTYCASSHD